MTGTNGPMKLRRRFNSTTPAHELTDFQTPDDKVFVVYHMGVPDMQRTPWRLSIAGWIGNSFASVPRNARGCGVFRVGERCFSP